MTGGDLPARTRNGEGELVSEDSGGRRRARGDDDDARPVTAAGSVIFGAHCRGCPLRKRCTTATDGRTLRLGSHHALQRAHRARAQLPSTSRATGGTARWWSAPSPG